MNNKVLAANKGIITIGTFNIEGTAKGVYLKFSIDGVSTIAEKGAHGESSFKITNTTTMKAELSLLQTSRDNEVLTAFLYGHFLTGTPFTLLYKEGNDIIECPVCMIEKHPEYEKSTDGIGTNTWSILMPAFVMNLGGGTLLS